TDAKFSQVNTFGSDDTIQDAHLSPDGNTIYVLSAMGSILEYTTDGSLTSAHPISVAGMKLTVGNDGALGVLGWGGTEENSTSQVQVVSAQK
ncbi:MAG TPA: hypothetical protein PLS70_20295, partial [Acidobacteriota bacterium]|nr:hypothetical protein [Acidobacteriota bacterium]